MRPKTVPTLDRFKIRPKCFFCSFCFSMTFKNEIQVSDIWLQLQYETIFIVADSIGKPFFIFSRRPSTRNTPPPPPR